MKRRNLLSGNFETPKKAEAELSEESGEDFERAALAKLGGSVAFVRGRKLIEE